MRAILFCFVALFAGNIAIPLLGLDQADEDRIIGGNKTTIEAYPYQVSLRYYGIHDCGGSVLTENIALTAAHCMEEIYQPWVYSIMVGSALIEGDTSAQIRTLTRMLPHPHYFEEPGPATNDIGLLYWEKPLVFGATVQPIALPPQSYLPVPYEQYCNVTGWGQMLEGDDFPMSDHLMAVTKPIISNEECDKAYKGVITDEMLCAGVPEGGLDACQGDSGGPLAVGGVQLGIVSFGKGCARPGFPGVYARVAFYSDWIKENMF